MADGSNIEWTEATWNPVTGCTKVSPGCRHCYAERLSYRLQAMGKEHYRNGFRLALHEDALAIPFAWRSPRLVFVNSMSDLFHEGVPLSFIQRVFQVMTDCPHHTFQVLTKRPKIAAEHASQLNWPKNVWLGASIERVRLFFVEEFLPYSWAFLPADASLQCSFRGDSNQASAYPRLSGGQPSLETVPKTVGLSPSGALPSGHSRGVLVRCRGKGGRPAMAVTTGFQGRTFDVPQTGVPCIDLPSRAPCVAADAVFADAKAFLSSSEARQMSESELERELHRRGQDLVRKLLQGHRDQRSPKEAAGPAEDTSGVECSEPREHESHAETTSGTMQVVGLGCARRGHDGLHRLDAALNLLPERYLVEMRRRVTIATASRAPPRTPWKPPRYSTSSTWQRRRGVRCSSPAHRRACRHLVRDPMGVDRPAVTLGCSCGCPQPPRAAGALMRTETSHEAREDQRKSPIGR